VQKATGSVDRGKHGPVKRYSSAELSSSHVVSTASSSVTLIKEALLEFFHQCVQMNIFTGENSLIYKPTACYYTYM